MSGSGPCAGGNLSRTGATRWTVVGYGNARYPRTARRMARGGPRISDRAIARLRGFSGSPCIQSAATLPGSGFLGAGAGCSSRRAFGAVGRGVGCSGSWGDGLGRAAACRGGRLGASWGRRWRAGSCRWGRVGVAAWAGARGVPAAGRCTGTPVISSRNFFRTWPGSGCPAVFGGEDGSMRCGRGVFGS